MYAKQFTTKLFNHAYISVIVLVVVVVMINGINACSRRSTPSPAKPPPRPSTKPSPRPTSRSPKTESSTETHSSALAQTTPKGKTTNVGSTASSSARTSHFPTSMSGRNYDVCFSTALKHLSDTGIKTKMDELDSAGNLSALFDGGSDNKRIVFLKWLISINDTNCSNIQGGYFIEIFRNKTTYHYEINGLNDTSAITNCKLAQDCRPLPFSTGSTSTSASTKTTSESSTTEPEPTKQVSAHPTNFVPAERSNNNKVPSTTIIIPVVGLILLLIVVIILVFWFKRRKKYKADKTPNSAPHLVGPVNGDVYTIANPNTTKEMVNEKSDNNDLVYTELSHMESGKSVKDDSNTDQTEYSDITHILRGNQTTYENVTSQNDEQDTYANVVELK